MTNISLLRKVAIFEGISYLLLGITMPIKYILEIPEPNFIVGMAHGVLFIAYITLVIIQKFKLNWDLKTTFWALLASILPFGTFVADSRIFKKYA